MPESTNRLIAKLERDLEQRRKAAAEHNAAAQPLAAEEAARQAAIAAEAAAAAAQREADAARLAEVGRELAQARRQAESERIAKIREAVETSPGAVTLAERARADFDKYGAAGVGDGRKARIELESARLFAQILGVSDTEELWKPMDPGLSAEANIFGCRWTAHFAPGEVGELRVTAGAHGVQIITHPADLARWMSEQPDTFAGILVKPEAAS